MKRIVIILFCLLFVACSEDKASEQSVANNQSEENRKKDEEHMKNKLKVEPSKEEAESF